MYLDIRSPREYLKGHATDSINIPLFNNKEFSNIGTIYKSKGKQEAIDKGLLYASKSILRIIRKVDPYKAEYIFVYCARGGMRSDGFAWLLHSLGYKVFKISGGYKSIRRHVLKGFNLKNKIVVLGGGTGTGKTKILSHVSSMGHNTIDLEAFANHRGSSFGDLGLNRQPTQQQFENDIYFKVIRNLNASTIYIESESRKIGKLIIPLDLWKAMGAAEYINISMDIERRIVNLLNEYGKFTKKNISDRILNIKKRLGGSNVKLALSYIANRNKKDLCRLLLESYYDKTYKHSYINRKNKKYKLKVSKESFDQIAKLLVKS